MEERKELEEIIRCSLKRHLKEPLIIAANWKMNMTILQGKQFAKKLDGIETNHKLLVFPPYTALASLASDFTRNKVGFGAQNMNQKDKGAYTGEISSEMLKEIGCGYVLIGHSERRLYYHETDREINQKVRWAIEEGFKVILCIGETLVEREQENYKEVLKNQLMEDLREINRCEFDNLCIAYEPVWAIGTGKSASLLQIEETHRFIKETLITLYDQRLPILYGGSVNEKNASEIAKKEGVDGFLIGGAGLDADKFISIIKQTENAWNGGEIWNP